MAHLPNCPSLWPLGGSVATLLCCPPANMASGSPSVKASSQPQTVSGSLSLTHGPLVFACSHCIQQILEAVLHCHQMGVVHRDLKVSRHTIRKRAQTLHCPLYFCFSIFFCLNFLFHIYTVSHSSFPTSLREVSLHCSSSCFNKISASLFHWAGSPLIPLLAAEQC